MPLKIVFSNLKKLEPSFLDLEYREMLREACHHFEVDGLLHLILNIPSKTEDNRFFHLVSSGSNIYLCNTAAAVVPALFDVFENQLFVQQAFSSDLEGKLLQFEPSLKFATRKPTGAHSESSVFLFALNDSNNMADEIRQRTYREFQLIGQFLHHYASSIYVPQDVGISNSMLTGREVAVLQKSGQGKTYSTIGSDLNISSRTVRFFLESARHKLGCSNTTHAVAMAMQQGLI